MGKKTSSTTVSKISSTASPAVSAATTTAQKSSILKSKFSPSALQLHLFASVIQSFESQQLRIHDTNTGRLRCQHAARPGINVTCLEWGYYGASYRESRQDGSRKKRKRDHNQHDNAVVAYGTSNSEICMFSPAEGKIVGKLGGVHDRGIKDFKFFTEDYLEAWSLGGDGNLIQWDLNNDQATRFVQSTIACRNLLTLFPEPFLCQIHQSVCLHPRHIPHPGYSAHQLLHTQSTSLPPMTFG